MHHRLQDLVHRGVHHAHTPPQQRPRTPARRLWQAHLTRLASSPVYEALLLAGIDLVLGSTVSTSTTPSPGS